MRVRKVSAAAMVLGAVVLAAGVSAGRSEGGAAEARLAEVVINITGAGTDSQYIQDGTAKQLNVVVQVGQTVRWVNKGDRSHTATSDVKDAMGNRIFDTDSIAAGSSATIEFNQARYDAAVKATGGTTGERVHLGYFCAKHPTQMGGKIVLQPAAAAQH